MKALRRAFLLPALVLIVLLPLFFLGYQPVSYLEGLSYDMRLANCTLSRLVNDELALIVKDDLSDEQVNLPYWPRSLYENSLRNIELAGGRVLGMDILFEDQGGTSKESRLIDEALAQSMAGGLATVLASRIFIKHDPDLGPIPRYRASLPLFRRSALSEGFINVNSDGGVVRSIRLYQVHPAHGGEQMIPSFALAMYLTELADSAWRGIALDKRISFTSGAASEISALVSEVQTWAGNRESRNFYESCPLVDKFSLAAFGLLGAGAGEPLFTEDRHIERLYRQTLLRFLLSSLITHYPWGPLFIPQDWQKFC